MKKTWPQIIVINPEHDHSMDTYPFSFKKVCYFRFRNPVPAGTLWITWMTLQLAIAKFYCFMKKERKAGSLEWWKMDMPL